MKVSINRFCEKGYKVRPWRVIMHQHWYHRYVDLEESCWNRRVRCHLHSQNSTSFCLCHIPLSILRWWRHRDTIYTSFWRYDQIPYKLYKERKGYKPINVKDYLFLNQEVSILVSNIFTDKKIALIFPKNVKPQHKVCRRYKINEITGSSSQIAGVIYVQGIRIKKSWHGAAIGASLGFAINYVGSSDNYNEIGLRRDRDSITVDIIISQIRDLVLSYDDTLSYVRDELCR